MTANPRTASVATGLLAILLWAASVAAMLVVPAGRILLMPPAAPMLVVLGCFVAAFALAEIALVHVEFSHQATSFSLSGVALLLGLLFCDVRWLILARVIGALLVFVWQRFTPLKLVYNLSSYMFEAALAGLCLHALLGGGARLTVPTMLSCLLVVFVVDLLMSSLVILVISWHQGGIGLRQAASVFIPGCVLGALSAVAAITVVGLLDEGAAGIILTGALGVSGALLYRGYLILRRRHRSLAVMHDFVQQGVGAAAMDELAEALLARTRRMLHASNVLLYVDRGEHELQLGIDEDDGFSVATQPRDTDWLFSRVRENDEAVVISRTSKEQHMRRWLEGRGLREAMIVPLPHSRISGLLVVTDRLGDTATFTAEDLTLLKTLAGHLVVALRGTQLVEQLRHDATHDALTGLANRFLLTERIDGSLLDEDTSARAGQGGPAVLLLDLDKFKEVNDALGHHVGDALLQVVGTRISSCAPAGATVARLGGDEFAVLLPDAPHNRALRIAENIRAVLARPVTLPEAVLSTRASIGIAIAAPGQTGPDLLRHADTAMYAAKGGADSIVVYSHDLDRGRAERLRLLADLHLALDRDELEVSYQPQLDLHTNRIVSVEALVRWRHPVQGLLSPDHFIPLAESSGLVEELTRQVLRQALRQCRQWRDQGLDLVVAVNMSAHTMTNSNLAEEIAAALAEAGLPADRLVLEITESILMGDPARSVPILQRLADIGVTISLDDFGTGYSSLAYLQKLPVSEVKIDKSFVMGLLPGDQAAASSVLVRSILSLGDSLGLRVVAEGVEDLHALNLLRELGCDLAQGFHISRPLTASQITAELIGAGVDGDLLTLAG